MNHAGIDLSTRLKHNNFIKHRFAVGVLGIVEVRAGDHWLEGSVNERHFQTVLR